VDITGRVLEMFSVYGYAPDEKFMQHALQFLKREQESDGSWFGRWGVNYIYGTALVLRGLEHCGVDQNEPMVQQAAEWLRMVQNPDGGWGESCDSYDDPNAKGIGPSTPSQTAWAVLGLLAAGDTRSESVQKGIVYLLRMQKADGTWDEEHFTGTGFPRVFYLAYHMYRNYFPLIALATYARVFEKISDPKHAVSSVKQAW
jgi:squalene-hopene/tetraprenyl-beta-curcumene cyclase